MRNLFPTISKEASSVPLPVSARFAVVSSSSEAERLAATACGVFSGIDTCEDIVRTGLSLIVDTFIAKTCCAFHPYQLQQNTSVGPFCAWSGLTEYRMMVKKSQLAS